MRCQTVIYQGYERFQFMQKQTRSYIMRLLIVNQTEHVSVLNDILRIGLMNLFIVKVSIILLVKEPDKIYFCRRRQKAFVYILLSANQS